MGLVTNWLDVASGPLVGSHWHKLFLIKKETSIFVFTVCVSVFNTSGKVDIVFRFPNIKLCEQFIITCKNARLILDRESEVQ